MNKLKLFAVATYSLISMSLFSYWPYQAQVFVNQTYGQATVTNFYGRPIYCQGQVFGATYFGATYNAWINSPIMPGASVNLYVYTSFNDPFVNAWSNIYCDWM